jgi:hypothetical protein
MISYFSQMYFEKKKNVIYHTYFVKIRLYIVIIIINHEEWPKFKNSLLKKIIWRAEHSYNSKLPPKITFEHCKRSNIDSKTKLTSVRNQIKNIKKTI